MPLRAKSHYAAVAMLELALRADESQPVSLRDIAEAHDVPLAFLNQILQQLKVAGLVQSSRGSAGGYRLQRPASMITLAEIVDAVSSPSRKPIGPSGSAANQILEQVWDEVERQTHDRLQAIRLEQLVQQASQAHESMFYI